MLFPGMDPYLEDPQLWPGVHASLIVYIRDYLQPLLRPRYLAGIEERVFLEGTEQEKIPDVWIHRRRKPHNGPVALLEADTPVVVKMPEVEVHERYVTIMDRSGEKLVAVIEVVSPTNKYAGPGRESYVAKQKETRRSTTHLVEIDLLRTGLHVLAVAEWLARAQGPYDYLTCVNRAQGERELFDLYPRTLRQRLPKIAIPLTGDDPDVVLDVQAVLAQTYENGSCVDRLDYRGLCRPALPKGDQAWATRLLKTGGKQGGRARKKRKLEEK